MLAAGIALLTGCGGARIDPDWAPGSLGDLARTMTGAYSSAEQAAADPDNYRDVRLLMAPAPWPATPDARWLYVEQAMASSLDKPYRQRVYRLSQNADGSFTSAVFTLPGDALRFARAADPDASTLASITPAELTERAGCAITLRWTPSSRAYVGSTRDKDCPSDLRGAAYATSDVVITLNELRSWDRGFDASGKQAWGAEKGPYIFRRIR